MFRRILLSIADYSESYKKIKCRNFQRTLHSTLWIWCFFIQCLSSLPCIFTKCLGVDMTVAIYPPGEIIVQYGQPLELFCVAKNYSSSDIQFLSGGRHLESEVVNSTTRRLYIEKPEKQSSTYYCHNIKTRKECVTRILVESPPTDVTDFNCISYNLEILNCSWTSLDSLSFINYSVTFSGNNYLATPTCYAKRVINSKNSKRYCTWNLTSKPRYRQQEENLYFYLTSCNVFGCNSQNFTIDHYSIVKPDPPYNLQVIENQTHSVDLMWNIPDNMIDLLHCGLDHIIEYQIAKIDNTTQFHRVNASFLPPKNKTYRFQLENLPYAHKQYEVRVFIKSKKAVKREFWSDFNYAVFYTASERPKRPPDTITGAFHKSAYSNNRVIYVYWKQLEEYEEAGTNFTYKVLVSQGNKTQIVYSDKNKSSSYVTLNETLNALDITVWSVNDKGSSINSSHFYIPAEKDTHSLKLTSFTKLSYENGTYGLSWVAIKNIDNYTLFWCQHHKTQICVGKMDFAVLDAKKSNHVIDLPREYRYQFAIAANNGSKTSGMMWANCDISKDGFVMYSFPVHLTYDAPGKTFVKEIHVVKVYGKDTSHRQVTITELQSFTNYSLTVQACNIQIGLCSKLRSKDFVTVTTKTGFPSRLKAPIVNIKRNKLHWKPPEIPGGRVDIYEIQRIKDDSQPEIINTTELSYSLDYCVGVVSSETYQVRAVNFDGTVPKNGNYEPPAAYVGPWSDPTTIVCRCKCNI